MKRLFQIITLRRSFRTALADSELLSEFEDRAYIICYQSGHWERVYGKDEVMRAIEKDHYAPIKYIINDLDVMRLDRDIRVESDLLEPSEKVEEK